MYEQGYQPQYPRRPSQGLSPFTKRVLVMLVVFVLLLPIANLLKGSNGHIVKATGLPGGAVSGGPLTTQSTTTTMAPPVTDAAASPAAVAPSAAPGPTTAPAPAQAAPKKKATTPPTTAAKRTTATTVKPKSPATTAAKQSAPTTAAKPKPAPTTAPKPVATTAPPPPPKTYTPAEVESIIREVWPDDLEDHALAIAQRESHLNPTSHNYCCYGLFAIYYEAGKRLLNSIGITSPAQLYDPWVNTRAALAIYQVAGWDPWKL
jgi:hypothetical protein